MENSSTFTIAVITATIAFIGMCIKTFTMVRDNILHQSKFIPKYHYHFDYVTKNNYPLTIIKLTLEQGDIPYYIKKIYLMKYRINCKIIYCKINDNNYNDLNNIHHIIQPSLKECHNQNTELEIAIPFSMNEKRELCLRFGYDKYPYESFIVIKLPPTDKQIK